MRSPLRGLLRRQRLGIAAALLAFSTSGAAAPMYQVLIGSYTSEGNSEGIYRMQFDAETGLIEPPPLSGCYGPTTRPG